MIYRKVLFLLCIVFLSVSAPMQLNVKASPTTIKVPQDYTTIQEAIYQASPGDIIQVSSGTYQENLVINKNLTLQGENKTSTIIEGSGSDYTVIQALLTTVNISGFTIKNGGNGIWLEKCNGSVITGNNITAISRGIWLHYSHNNTISDNTVGGCKWWCGIVLCGRSSNNTVIRNTIRDNRNGLGITGENNLIIHNNFINNQNQTRMIESHYNAWNNTYEGNYWSDYTGTDVYSGPYQNITGSDGIGDTPYVIDDNNIDHHPLMLPWGSELLQTDLNHDGIVNILDISIIAIAFGSTPGDPHWNETADLNNDQLINILDISMVAKDYGKTA
jgi:parallel beta-helix repeat protein